MLCRHEPAFTAVLIDQSVGHEAAKALAASARAAGIARCLIVLSPFERRQFGSPREAGFTGFLVKPVRARSLYERLAGTAAPAPAGRRSDSIGQPAQAPARPRLTVLVAEDNEINALLATRTLERLGCVAIWARDGREALSHVEAGLGGSGPRFDLVLLDIRMPDMDGLAAARAIRALEASRGEPTTLPLVAVSANVAAGDRSAALAAGMNDCLAKPLERAALQRWLDRVEAKVPLTRSA